MSLVKCDFVGVKIGTLAEASGFAATTVTIADENGYTCRTETFGLEDRTDDDNPDRFGLRFLLSKVDVDESTLQQVNDSWRSLAVQHGFNCLTLNTKYPQE